MIRLLVFLCFVGTGFYLLAPLLAPQERAAEERAAEVSESSQATGVPASSPPISSSPLSSWGSSLQVLREDRADTAPGEPNPSAEQAAQRAQATNSVPSAAEIVPSPDMPSRVEEEAPALTVAKQDATDQITEEWVRLTASVKTRSAASVSSPGLWSYPAGSKAKVVGRDGGWVQLQDPETEARGWVYHAYLAPADAARTETARKPSLEKIVSPTQRKPTRTAKPATRTADPAVQTAAPVKVRKAKRQRRGLFKRRRAQKAWTVGPAR